MFIFNIFIIFIIFFIWEFGFFLTQVFILSQIVDLILHNAVCRQMWGVCDWLLSLLDVYIFFLL